MPRALPVILIVSFFFITSCANKIPAVDRFGYIENIEGTEENIMLYATKWGIDPSELYVLDDVGYKKEIWSYDDENKRLTHDLYQWHQLMVYDENDQIVSYQLNCRTKVEEDDWNFNADGTFDTYPPSDKSLLWFNKSLNLNQLSPYYKQLNGISLAQEKLSQKDLTIVVYWSIYHGRQTKNLIKVVKDYQKANSEEKVKYVFVNNDKHS